MKMNRNVAILFFTLVVVMIGFGLIIPIMPFYVESFGAGGTALGTLMAVFSITQFLSAPLWGNLSDRYGRKPILALGALGNALSLVLMGLSTQLWMLFAARALAGLLSSATLPTAMAFIADSTSDSERGGGMGIIGAAMGLGMVLGPGVGGVLAGNSLHMPFYLAGGLSAIAFLLILVILPESLPVEKRAQTAAVTGPQWRQMGEALGGPAGFLLFLAFLVNFALASFEGVFGLFAQRRFDFGPAQVGTIMTVVGVISVIAQGALTGPATRKWGDERLILASLLGSAIAFPLMLLARSFAGVLVTVGVFVFSNSMLRPVIASAMSRRAAGGQGTAMGMNNAFQSLGRIAGPLSAGALLDARTTLPYLSGGLIMAVGYLLSLRRLPPERQPAPATAQ